MTTKVIDKNRRSYEQQAFIGVRVSQQTKQRIEAIARRERRATGAQAALFIEQALDNASA